MNFLGTEIGLGGFSLSNAGYTIIIIIGMILVAVIVGILSFSHYYKKYKKIAYKNQIPIFVEVAGKIRRIGIDYGKELFVPGTNISLFFLRDRKIYLARPTRAMGNNEFWYKILENGEWVNFELSKHPDDDALSVANYDHRDTRYAFVNLNEIVKRNYKDKSTQWWKEYSGVITIVVVGIMFIGCMWFFFWRTGIMLEQMGPISENIKEASRVMSEAVNAVRDINSGVIPAG